MYDGTWLGPKKWSISNIQTLYGKVEALENAIYAICHMYNCVVVMQCDISLFSIHRVCISIGGYAYSIHGSSFC